MPQITSSAPSKRKTSSSGSIPPGMSNSSHLLSHAFQKSVHRFPYRTFSSSPYQDFLYAPELPEDLLPVLKKIYDLLALSADWDGYGACAPEYSAVEYAHRWLLLFYCEVSGSGQNWRDPVITASGEGEVVFEWWEGSKKITIYIGNQSAEYVKVWGPDINTDMEDGQADSPELRNSLWQWLMS